MLKNKGAHVERCWNNEVVYSFQYLVQLIFICLVKSIAVRKSFENRVTTYYIFKCHCPCPQEAYQLVGKANIINFKLIHPVLGLRCGQAPGKYKGEALSSPLDQL